VPGGHGRGRGPGRRQRGRRSGRLEPVLLLLLHHGPAHGYTLLGQLDPFGLSDVDPSMVYRALNEMEQQGLVVSTRDDHATQGPPRRIYNLTAAGDNQLQAHMLTLTRERDAINAFLQASEQHMEQGSGPFHAQDEDLPDG